MTFKYDPFGRRIEKVSSAGTSIYAYDGDNLIEETDGSGNVVARYSQTENVDEPLAMLRGGATSFYEQDGLGSVTSLTNAGGALAQTYTYDSFGKLTASAGSLTNPFQYTGREFDTEIGLYYYRARYYDQSLGRFLSEDPIRFGFRPRLKSTQTPVDFYSYVANSPLNMIDPLGLYQVVVGVGDGVGVLITFGYNSGQFNLGFYGGAGTGAFISVDLSDSGCHKPGFVGGERGEGDIGVQLPGRGLSLSASSESDTNGEKSSSITAKVPGVGVTFPIYPSAPPHGVFGAGLGGFIGLGGTSYSPGPNGSCGCNGK